MDNLHQLPCKAQQARRRKRRHIRCGHQRIGKVERAGRASFSFYKSMISARPRDRA
jgi:hypothetical protein